MDCGRGTSRRVPHDGLRAVAPGDDRCPGGRAGRATAATGRRGLLELLTRGWIGEYLPSLDAAGRGCPRFARLTTGEVAAEVVGEGLVVVVQSRTEIRRALELTPSGR